MLEQQRHVTSNFLLNDDEDAKFDREHIYVPLALVERRKPDSKEDEHSPEAGTKLYKPQYEEKQKFEHQAFLQQILEEGEGKTQGKRIALIGEPGAGKTTLLQTIAFWVLETDLGLPIWISLADLRRNANLIDFQTYLFETWLKQAVSPSKKEVAKQELEAQIERGRVWLLLDGVDEVVTSDADISEYISEQLKGWLARSRILLTCRLNVWQADLNFLSDFETYRLLDFGYPQQVHQFINNWFVKQDVSKGERLKTELNNSDKARLRDLIQNPLRLTLLCSSWQSHEANLPETKAQLYTQFVRQFYHWKQNRFPVRNRKQEELNLALGKLAIKDIDGNNSRFRLRESFIIRELGYPDEEDSSFYLALQLGWLNYVGIAAESSTQEKVYAFFHPNFEEYFAAYAIDDWHFFLPRDYVDEQIEEQEYRIFKSQWKEVVLLWLGRDDIGKEEKENFINALVKIDREVFEHLPDVLREVYEHRPYFIAAAGINEFKEYSKTSEIVQQVIEWLYSSHNLSVSDNCRSLANIALTETNRTEAIAGLVNLINSITNTDKYYIKNTLIDAALKLWAFDPGNEKSISGLANVINPDSVYPEQHTSNYLRAVEYLGKIGVGNEQAVSALVRSISSHAYILKYPPGFGYHYNLVQKLLWQEVASLVKIGVGNKQAITIFVDWIASNTTNLPILKLAAYILGKIGGGNEQAISAVVNLIKSSTDRFTPNLAVEILGDIGVGNKQAISAVVNLIKSSTDRFTVNLAVEILGEIGVGNKQAIFAIVELIDSVTEEDTLILAATSFWKIGVGKEQAISGLGKLINCIIDESFLLHVAKSLLKLDPGNKQAISTLFKLISCADQKIGMQATEIFENYELNRIKER